jgi:hypothetical protein
MTRRVRTKVKCSGGQGGSGGVKGACTEIELITTKCCPAILVPPTAHFRLGNGRMTSGWVASTFSA